MLMKSNNNSLSLLKWISFILCFSLLNTEPVLIPEKINKLSQCEDRLYYPKHYVSYFTDTPLVNDGNLNEIGWTDVAWTDEFVDISTNVVPRYSTKAKIRWDNNFLYVGALLQEPDVWANITQHNEVIFHDNDFEVFVDADGSTHNYKEYEMNANNATWDLLLNKPYDDGGFENSTRVFPEDGWEMQPPLYCRTHVNGTINNPSDHRDNKFWSVEIALPLSKLAELKNVVVPPRHGDIWRINFSRVEWRVIVVNGTYWKDPNYPNEDNWVWSPQGSIAMHLPEKWGFIQFSTEQINSTQFVKPLDWAVRSVAMDLYYAQHSYQKSNQSFTQDLSLLQALAPNNLLDGVCATVTHISLVNNGFIGIIEDSNFLALIRNDRFLTVTAK
eukprot:c27474_g1_i1.p1 GENE.c27474_g1_i1~~c27474_g1_i1.p1  ORF type:complete len:386 (+),score=142.90 c27474_g1_i1:2-1159(+)